MFAYGSKTFPLPYLAQVEARNWNTPDAVEDLFLARGFQFDSQTAIRLKTGQFGVKVARYDFRPLLVTMGFVARLGVVGSDNEAWMKATGLSNPTIWSVQAIWVTYVTL